MFARTGTTDITSQAYDSGNKARGMPAVVTAVLTPALSSATIPVPGNRGLWRRGGAYPRTDLLLRAPAMADDGHPPPIPLESRQRRGSFYSAGEET